MDDELLSVPIFASLNKPNLWMSADREMTMSLMLIIFILVAFIRTGFAFILALALWAMVLPLLRWMAKADPNMRFVFLKQMHHQAFYPAHSSEFMRIEK